MKNTHSRLKAHKQIDSNSQRSNLSSYFSPKFLYLCIFKEQIALDFKKFKTSSAGTKPIDLSEATELQFVYCASFMVSQRMYIRSIILSEVKRNISLKRLYNKMNQNKTKHYVKSTGAQGCETFSMKHFRAIFKLL